MSLTLTTQSPAARRRYQIIMYTLLVLVSIILMFPLVFALSLALQGETIAPSLLPPDMTKLDWGVFAEVFRQQPVIGRWIINSFVVAGTVTLGVLITSSLLAYVLSFMKFPGKLLLLFFALGTLMVPFEATLIPNYLLIASLKWTDSFQGLIIPFIASGFGVFLLRQAFLTLPPELYDAAVVDGCGHLRYLVSIVLPLARPTLATLAVYSFLTTWNQFYWPLLVTNDPEWRTTQVGITVFRSFEYAVFNVQMAATLLVMLPTLILLVIGQRQLVSGLTAGALKG
ncbi:MAG: carbohydrate ABC transporter permease [Armatimonadetes bacterium]|nr:carbohydrate ABC transporter permease [Anaerolineae bacterium]